MLTDGCQLFTNMETETEIKNGPLGRDFTSFKHGVSSTGSELLIGSTRVLFSSLCLPFVYVIAMMLLPGTAYLVTNWRHLSLIMAVPGVACIPFWW